MNKVNIASKAKFSFKRSRVLVSDGIDAFSDARIFSWAAFVIGSWAIVVDIAFINRAHGKLLHGDLHEKYCSQ